MIDSFLNIGMMHYLILSFILFLTGLLGVVVSRNLLRIVMSLFILTVSIVLSFLTFGCYCDNSLDNANIISIFILMVSVLQIIMAVVILYKIYQTNEYLDAEKIKDKEN